MEETSIGILLRKLRTSRGISQRELERRAGIAHGHWGYIETGERLPTISLVAKAISVLELTHQEYHLLLALTLRERAQQDVEEYKQALASLDSFRGTITMSRETPNALQANWEDWQNILWRENLAHLQGWSELYLAVHDQKHELTVQWLG